MSGSSVVHADSKYFRLELESVRKIFAGGEGDHEREWHDDWKKETQPIANRARDKLQKEIEPLVGRYSLRVYSSALPEVIEDAEDEAEDVLKAGKPFRYRFRFGRASVWVAFAKLPSKGARAELKKALGRHLPED